MGQERDQNVQNGVFKMISELPPRAKGLFLLTLLLVSFSIGVRLAGYRLSRLERILIDGPTLTTVAFSSLVWATYRHNRSGAVLSEVQADCDNDRFPSQLPEQDG